MVERAVGELGIDADVRLVCVTDRGAAERLRFLGPPTIRVGGRDIELGADERTDYALTCRIFRTDAGLAGQPKESWIRDALARERYADVSEGRRLGG